MKKGYLGIIMAMLFIAYITSFNYGGCAVGHYKDEDEVAITASSAPLPSAVSSLNAIAISSTQINLTWQDNSNSEEGVKIERRTDVITYTQIATVGANGTRYVDTDVIEGITYYYRIRAYNSNGDSMYSNEVSATIPFNGPSSLNVMGIGESQIGLAWQDNSNGETGFKIERKTGISGNYAQIATVNPNTTAYSDTVSQIGVTYYYRVKAYNANGDTNYSNESSIAFILDAPANLSATVASPIQINLMWDDNASCETGFKIERKTGSGGTYSQIASGNANVISYSDNSAIESTTYFYQVRAYNSTADSNYSNETSALTTPLNTPSFLSATVISPTQITITWVDNSNVESGYTIERKIDITGTYTQIITFSPNTTSYSDTTVSPNTTYYYRIQAYNSTGNSLYSNETSVDTTRWSKVIGNYSYTVALKTDGTLWAWGAQGNGDYYNSNSLPVKIGTANNWQTIAKGWYHTLAIKTDGTLWTWGWNNYGQLGLGDTINRTLPTQVGTDTNWQSVVGGGYHTVAIKSDGTLWAWGDNEEGQLGLGDTITDSFTSPNKVGTDTNWQSIAGGGCHTVAVKTNGTIWAWGFNGRPQSHGGFLGGFGQLGLGDIISCTLPTQVGTDTNWQTAACGDYHTLALKVDGTLWTWGYNNTGILGLGDTTNRLSPVQIGIDINWQTIATGWYHNLAIKSDGTLWAWGDNIYGQLGDGSIVDRRPPNRIGTNINWSAIAGGGWHTIALKTDGTLWTWGHNSYGQLGLGDTIDRNTPTQVGQ